MYIKRAFQITLYMIKNLKNYFNEIKALVFYIK